MAKYCDIKECSEYIGGRVTQVWIFLGLQKFRDPPVYSVGVAKSTKD